MEMLGKIELKKPPQVIWDALNSSEVLEQCIPGCEEFKKNSAPLIGSAENHLILCRSTFLYFP